MCDGDMIAMMKTSRACVVLIKELITNMNEVNHVGKMKDLFTFTK